MNKQNLVEQRNKLMHDAGTIMQSETITAENRSTFDRMMIEADGLTADIERIERSEAFAAEQRNATRPPRSQPGDVTGPADADKTKAAFRTWMRTGVVSAEHRSILTPETRDLNITNGAVLVPTGFDPQLNIALKSFGAIVGAVRNYQTSFGGPVKVALSDDTETVLSLATSGVAVAESDPNLSGFVSNTDLLTTGLVKIGNDLLQDSAFSVDDFIQNIFAARYYRGMAGMIAQGNGSNIQKLTPSKIITAPTGSTTAVTYATLVDMYAALDPAYLETSQFVCNSTVKADLMKLTDGYGRPLLQTDINGVPFNSLFGRSFVTSQGADAMTAGKTPILFGDLHASYTLRTVAGSLSIARSTDRFFETNETAYIGYVRAGAYNTSQSASSSLVGLTMAAN